MGLDTNARCQKLMSALYKANKPRGCVWCNKPYNFLLRNASLLGHPRALPKRIPIELCEQILTSLLPKIVEPKVTYNTRAVPEYEPVRAFLATAKGIEVWRQLRFDALRESGGKCCLCGASSKTGAVLHVDHIKPKSLHPDLAFTPSNLQVLCEDCNMGKGNRSSDDFRRNK